MTMHGLLLTGVHMTLLSSGVTHANRSVPSVGVSGVPTCKFVDLANVRFAFFPFLFLMLYPVSFCLKFYLKKTTTHAPPQGSV